MSELLAASDTSFRRLYGRMTEKKLTLFEFASCAMAKAGTSATEIIGRIHYQDYLTYMLSIARRTLVAPRADGPKSGHDHANIFHL